MPLRRIEDLVGEPLEGLVHALGGLPGGGEEAHAGAVGGVLLRAHIGEQRVLDRRLRRRQRRHAGLAGIAAAGARGGDHGAGAEDHRDDRLRSWPARNLLAQARQVPAGDVAGLVREHADHLVRRVRLHQRAGIDEDAPAVGDERVERAAG